MSVHEKLVIRFPLPSKTDKPDPSGITTAGIKKGNNLAKSGKKSFLHSKLNKGPECPLIKQWRFWVFAIGAKTHFFFEEGLDIEKMPIHKTLMRTSIFVLMSEIVKESPIFCIKKPWNADFQWRLDATCKISPSLKKNGFARIAFEHENSKRIIQLLDHAVRLGNIRAIHISMVVFLCAIFKNLGVINSDVETEGSTTAPLSSAVGGLGAGRIPREAVADEGASPSPTSPTSPNNTTAEKPQDKIFKISLDSVNSPSPPTLVNHKDAAKQAKENETKEEVRTAKLLRREYLYLLSLFKTSPLKEKQVPTNDLKFDYYKVSETHIQIHAQHGQSQLYQWISSRLLAKSLR
ncbi:unnamed protein product, partial [Nesidiocoris tenuis]